MVKSARVKNIGSKLELSGCCKRLESLINNSLLIYYEKSKSISFRIVIVPYFFGL